MKKFILIVLSVMISLPAMAKDKVMELSLQGGYDYKMFTPSFAAMFFLTPDSLVGLKAGSNESGDEKQTHIAVQYKKFYSETFYVAGETFYLNSLEDTDDLWYNKQTAKYVSLGLGARIGNQWRWDKVTAGCDWIGVGQRIGRFSKESGNINNTTATFFNVYVGVSF